MSQNGQSKKDMCNNGFCPNSCIKKEPRRWDIHNIYQCQANNRNKYAVLVLNRPISQTKEFIIPLWNNAAVRFTVDGGTVKWDNYLSSLPLKDQLIVKDPDFVTGDFDSITPEVLARYRKKGCKIIHTPDQLHTDFTKALMELSTHCKENNIQLDNVIALAQTSGRLDQVFANIQTLYLVKKKQIFNESTRMFIICGDNLAWLLHPEYRHIINIPRDVLGQRKPLCSLIPVGEGCQSVTTSGLKWNLDDGELAFGKLVSTSNMLDGSEQVKVECSNTLLWTVRVPLQLNNT